MCASNVCGYVNVGPLNGEPLEEVDWLKYLGSNVAADGGCESDVARRMNGGY